MELPEMYQFTVSEGATVGTSVGRVIATDDDMGENTDMGYLISDQEGGELFKVTTDVDTQEAVICIKKVQHRLAPGWTKSTIISIGKSLPPFPQLDNNKGFRTPKPLDVFPPLSDRKPEIAETHVCLGIKALKTFGGEILVES